jgi:hypothetical protein
MLDFSFDVEDVPERTRGKLLPPGTYVMEIVNAVQKTTKKGDGAGVNILWKVTEGEFKGATVFQFLVTTHPNEEFALSQQQDLRDIVVAIGLKKVTDLNQLLNRECNVKIGVRSDKNGQYDDQNVVKGVWPYKFEPKLNAAFTSLNDDISHVGR